MVEVQGRGGHEHGEVVDRVVEVGGPAVAQQIKGTFGLCRVEDLALLGLQLDVDVQHGLELGLQSLRHEGVLVVVRVRVGQGRESGAVRVTGFRQQGLGLPGILGEAFGFLAEVAFAGVGEHVLRHPGGAALVVRAHGGGDGVAAQGQGDGLAHADVIERFDFQVRHDADGVEHVPDGELVGALILRLDVVRQAGGHIDLAGFIRRDLRLRVVDDLRGDGFELYVIGVVEIGVFLHRVILALNVIGQHERAVAQGGFRVGGPGGIVVRGNALLGRIIDRQREQLQEVAAGLREVEFQRLVVGSGHLHVLPGALAAVVGFGAGDDIELVGIDGLARLRVKRTADGIDEIGRRHIGAFAPLRVVAELERPHKLIVAHGVGFGRLVDLVALVVKGDQRRGAQAGEGNPAAQREACRVKASLELSVGKREDLSTGRRRAGRGIIGCGILRRSGLGSGSGAAAARGERNGENRCHQQRNPSLGFFHVAHSFLRAGTPAGRNCDI